VPVDDVLGWLRAYAVVGSTASLVRGSEVQAERGQGSEACTGVVRERWIYLCPGNNPEMGSCRQKPVSDADPLQYFSL